MTKPASANKDSGVILINVLSVLALSSAVMVAILTLQDVSIERSTRFMDSAAASAYALGGEASAIVALRRDAIQAPEADHYNEPWAAVQDSGSAIEGGKFSLAIEDEQSRFNLNNLLTDGLGAEEMLRTLLQSLKATPGLASVISAFVVQRGGLDDLQDLAGAGIEPKLIARFADFTCVLPKSTDININTAGETLLAAALGNPASARLLISKRERQGFLTPADLAAARVLLPARTSFTSNYFAVTVTVTYGTVTQSLTSQLVRTKKDDVTRVKVWSRKKNTAARFPEPPHQT